MRPGERIDVVKRVAERIVSEENWADIDLGPTADEFDIGRTPNHHMAFGAGGAHFCLGANLAKLEIKIVFEELAKRIPDIRLAGDVKRMRTNLVDSISCVPVEFTPTPAVHALAQ